MVPGVVALDLDVVSNWVLTLHGESPGIVNVCSTENWQGRFFDLAQEGRLADLLAYVQQLDDREVQGIYMRCTTMKEVPRGDSRGTVEQSLALPGLWGDVDRAGPGHKEANLPRTFQDATAILEAARLPLPSCWVESGGGWYPWWLLKDPHVLTDDHHDLQDLSERWHRALEVGAAQLGFKYGAVHDLARVLRLPGTVNRKAGLERQALIHSWDGGMYELSQLYEAAANAPQPAPAPRPAIPRPRTSPEAGLTPFDDYEARVDWEEILEGWQFSHQHGQERYWVRPGKDVRDGHSASTGRESDRDRLFVFSTSTEFEAWRPYTKGAAYAVLHHNGNMSAAASALRSAGYGQQAPTNVSNLESWASGEVKSGPTPTVDEEPEDLLPDDFWTARATLKQIHDAAHSRQRSAEAVLGACLARIAAMSSHRFRIPPIVGDQSSLTVFSVIVAPSGVGKTTANGIAKDLMPAPEDFYDCLPIGTGEGMAEAYYGDEEEEVEGLNGKMKMVSKRRIVRHNALFYLDEGQAIGQLASRVGSTLLQTMRSAFSGSTLGAMNASAERRRIVPGNQYAMGVIIGVQDSLAGALLDDEAGGTPQRCLWFSAVDQTIPHPDLQPYWPGPLRWAPIEAPIRVDGWLVDGASGPYEMDFDPEIVKEVKLADYAKSTGQVVNQNSLDSHAYLIRCKTAALLALLEERFKVNLEDWRLAGVIQERSNRLRDRIVGTIAEDRRRVQTEAAIAQAQREELVAEHREAGMTQKLSARVLSLLARADVEMTRRDIRSRLTKYQREFLVETIDMLKAAGKIVEVEMETDVPGGERRKVIRLA